AIALVRKVVFALLRTDFGEGFGDCCDERFDGSGGDLSQQGFEFSEELFDGVEVWAVRGQVAQLGARRGRRRSSSRPSGKRQGSAKLAPVGPPAGGKGGCTSRRSVPRRREAALRHSRYNRSFSSQPSCEFCRTSCLTCSRLEKRE